MTKKMMLAACAGAGALALSVGAAGAADPVKIKAVNFDFKPAKERAKLGQTVIWKSKQGRHTVTIDDLGFDEVIKEGERTKRRFKVEGTYPYYCRFHNGMDVTVTVTG